MHSSTFVMAKITSSCPVIALFSSSTFRFKKLVLAKASAKCGDFSACKALSFFQRGRTVSSNSAPPSTILSSICSALELFELIFFTSRTFVGSYRGLVPRNFVFGLHSISCFSSGSAIVFGSSSVYLWISSAKRFQIERLELWIWYNLGGSEKLLKSLGRPFAVKKVPKNIDCSPAIFFTVLQFTIGSIRRASGHASSAKPAHLR